MSVKYINWAFQIEGLNPTKKVILIALADNANDDGQCWPSISKLCKKTGIGTKTTLRSNLKDLVKLGFVSVENRVRSNGSIASNMYTLLDGSKINLGLEIDTRTGSELGGGTGSELGVPYEPSLEPSLEPPINIDQKDFEIKFDRFWKRYPRKVGKKKALKAFAKIDIKNDDTWRSIMFGLTEFVKYCEIKNKEKEFIKHPSTWLGDECWNDELDHYTPIANQKTSKPPNATDRLKERLQQAEPQDSEMKVINQ